MPGAPAGRRVGGPDELHALDLTGGNVAEGRHIPMSDPVEIHDRVCRILGGEGILATGNEPVGPQPFDQLECGWIHVAAATDLLVRDLIRERPSAHVVPRRRGWGVERIWRSPAAGSEGGCDRNCHDGDNETGRTERATYHGVGPAESEHNLTYACSMVIVTLATEADLSWMSYAWG